MNRKVLGAVLIGGAAIVVVVIANRALAAERREEERTKEAAIERALTECGTDRDCRQRVLRGANWRAEDKVTGESERASQLEEMRKKWPHLGL